MDYRRYQRWKVGRSGQEPTIREEESTFSSADGLGRQAYGRKEESKDMSLASLAIGIELVGSSVVAPSLCCECSM